jgi:hypothetical protein
MCFSATASFVAAITLGCIGIATIKKVRHPAQIAFACIPFFFAVQQLIEGSLWLTLANPLYHKWQMMLTYLFLIFAEILWPMCVPLAIILIEPKNKQTKIQKLFIVIGFSVAIYFTFCLINYPINANIVGHHIKYLQYFPESLDTLFGLMYLIATIGPALFSKIKYIGYLGITILLSCVITAFFYNYYLISVWCFFSSIISFSVYAIVTHLQVTRQAAEQLPVFNINSISKL